MKNNLFKILSITIKNNFKLAKLKTMNKRKLIGMIIFILFIVFSLGSTMFVYNNVLFETLEKANIVSIYLPTIFIISILGAFVFTIYTAKSVLFESKDNDLLLHLPIPAKTVLFARLVTLYFYNLLFSMMFVVPGIIIYAINIPTNILFYIIAVVLLIFTPIIPTILSSLFGYLMAYLVSKTNLKNFFELMYSVLFIAIYFIVSSNFSKILTSITNNPIIISKILKYGFFPVYLMNQALATNNLLYVLYYILLNIGIIVLFVYILDNSYFKIIAKLNAHKTKSNYKINHLTSKSVKQALLMKEIKRYFSSAVYVLNTLFGVLLMIVLAIASLFYSVDTLTTFMDIDSTLTVFPLLLVALSFAISNTTCVSVSMERDNFWILKSSPINPKNIFKAKLLLNYLVVLPVTCLSLILLKFSLGLTMIELILLLVYVIILTLVISNYGLIINLLLPHLTANNDTEIVKRSASCMVGMVVPAMLLLFGGGALLTINVNNNILVAYAIAILFVIFIILKIILNNWGIKKFNKI